MKALLIVSLAALYLASLADADSFVINNQGGAVALNTYLNNPFSVRLQNPIRDQTNVFIVDDAQTFRAEVKIESSQVSITYGDTTQLPLGPQGTDFVIVVTPSPGTGVSTNIGFTYYTNAGSTNSMSINVGSGLGSTAVTTGFAAVNTSAPNTRAFFYPFALTPDQINAMFASDCADLIKDNAETAVDCGGACTPCTCSDGIQNQGEFGVDCGYPCATQCPGILDYPFDTNPALAGGNTNGATATGAYDWTIDGDALHVGSPDFTPIPYRSGVLSFSGGSVSTPSFSLNPKGFTIRFITSFNHADTQDPLLACSDWFSIRSVDPTLQITVARDTNVYSFPAIPGDLAQTVSWADIFVEFTPTGISVSSRDSMAAQAVFFSATFNTPKVFETFAPSTVCSFGGSSISYDRVTFYNGLGLSDAQETLMYDDPTSIPPPLAHCADGVQNLGEEGVDCGAVCPTHPCASSGGGNGGGGNGGNGGGDSGGGGSTCASCAGQNIQVRYAPITGEGYGIADTHGKCLTLRIRPSP